MRKRSTLELHLKPAFSNLTNNSEITFSLAEMGWKNFVNECLMETEIFKGDKNENEECLYIDPKFVMDMRHRMVKQSANIIPMSEILIHTEALKLLRIENHCSLLRQKERKLVEKEIAKVKQILEHHQFFIKKKINESSNKKVMFHSNETFPKPKKLNKRLEYSSKVYNVNTWQSQSVQVAQKSQREQHAITYIKESSTQKQCLYEFSESTSSKKDSPIPNNNNNNNNNNKFENQLQKTYDTNKNMKIDDKIHKNEIMRRFFEKEVHTVHNITQQEKVIKYSVIENLVNQKRMEHAWCIWKAYIHKIKSNNKERTAYKNKIETFLTKFKEKEMKMERLKLMNVKQEDRANLMTRTRTRTRKTEIHLNAKEKKEKLEKLMSGVKTSQIEACQKLKEMKFRGLGSQEKCANVKFLTRMEERRAERLKHRKEVEEKKRKVEEMREKAQREKEKEERWCEEEFKRKSLEELKEKRRLEKERKEKRKKEKENLRLKVMLADNHYKKYVLRSYGLRPWKTVMKISDSKNQCALAFFERKLKSKVFRKWTSKAREELSLKVAGADAFYEKVLKRKCLFNWVLFRMEKMKQDQVALDWSEFKIIQRAFKRWLNFIQNENADYLNKKYAAERNYEKKLKMKYLTKLRSYPELKKLEQAKEHRKMKWRQKVKEILPDYQPVEISDNI